MKIARKVAFAGGLTLAAIGACAAMVGWAWTEMNAAERLRRDSAEVLQNLSEVRMISFEYRLFHTERTLVQWRSVVDRIDRVLEAFEAPDPEAMALLSSLRQNRIAAKRLVGQIIAIGNDPGSVGAGEESRRLAESLFFAELVVLQQDAYYDGIRLIALSIQRSKSAHQRVLAVIAASLALIALLVGAAASMAKRQVLAPLLRLQQATQAVAAGDLEVRLGMARGDEIGELANNFDTMTRSLRDAFEQIKRSNLALASAEERFRAMFESAPTAMVMLDQAGTIAMVNAQTEALFGYARNELVGQSVDMLVPERLRGAHPAHRDGFFARPQARRMGDTRDLYALRKDGREILVEIGLNPISTPEGLFALSAIFDLTERKRALDEINNLNVALVLQAGQLEIANRELESFSYSVSHDLRAPLRAMDGFSLVLLEDYGAKLDAEGKDALERIRAGSQRMGALIDDLLRLANVTRAPLDVSPVDLSALARECADALRRAQPGRAVQWQIEPRLRVAADAPLMRIAMQNLLENAWKFSGRKEQATIRVGAVESDGRKAIFVADDGAGFDTAYAGRMFDAFQRLHRADEFKGTGIGLAIVKRIVQRHGGRIWAEAKPGAGATFYFTVADKGGDSREQRHSAG